MQSVISFDNYVTATCQRTFQQEAQLSLRQATVLAVSGLQGHQGR